MLNNAKAFKGGNNQLVVAVERFDPDVVCHEPLQSNKETCGEIISRLPKSYQPRRFGNFGDRTADYLLPYKISSSKDNWSSNCA